jgi:ABC-type multidrug transport system fused ATPase/permease subunit
MERNKTIKRVFRLVGQQSPFFTVLGDEKYKALQRLWILRGTDGILLVVPLIVAALFFLFFGVDSSLVTLAPIDLFYLLTTAYGAILILRKAVIWHTNRRMNQAAFEYGLKQRQETLEHLLAIPSESLAKLHRGAIAQSLSDDLLWLENWCSFIFPMLLVDMVAIIVLLSSAAVIHWPLTLLTGVFLLLSVFFLWLLSKITHKNHADRSTHMAEATQLIAEHMKGMDVLRTLGLSATQKNKFSETEDIIRKASYTAVKKTLPGAALFFAAVQASLAISIIILIIVAEQDWGSVFFASPLFNLSSLENVLNLSIGMLFLAALNTPIRSLFTYLNLWQLAALSAKKLSAIEQMPAQYSGKVNTLLHPLDIQFANVHYRYDAANSDAVSDLSFTIAPNSLTAIVGPSGAGKSTLLQLLMRFSDVSQGSISMANVNIREIDIAILLNKFSVVFQETVLFNDTIANNIKVGKPSASMDAITQAAKRACIHEMIVTLPEGYDTVLGVSGISLSGGERQRVAIARAILKDAPIVILDEATASLDPENERVIQQAITALSNNKTVIMIAHRLGTIIWADQIIVMHEGRIVGIGRHVDLVNNNKTYAGLWNAYIATSQWKMGKA